MEEGEVAESKRRGEKAVDEHLDEVLDDAVRDDALDDELDGDLAADEDDELESADTLLERRNGQGAGKEGKGVRGKPPAKAKVATDTERVGIFGRLGRFVREVVAELRKVIWPTRKELLTYTAVVVVFVAIILSIVGLLDLGFAKAVLYVFGGKK
jgi:preprotein translocase subunit SecE